MVCFKRDLRLTSDKLIPFKCIMHVTSYSWHSGDSKLTCDPAEKPGKNARLKRRGDFKGGRRVNEIPQSSRQNECGCGGSAEWGQEDDVEDAG
jgi:hypothetical protein